MTTATMTNEALYAKAHEAGMAAGKAALPTPMIVRDEMTDHVYPPVMDGVCGFAWVTIRPANSPFARWLKQRGLGHKGYHGGWEYWVSGFGQSYERKYAYARAFSKVLGEAGIKAYAGGRLD